MLCYVMLCCVMLCYVFFIQATARTTATKIRQSRYESNTKERLHFSDLQYILYAYIPHIHMPQLIEILRSVTNGS